MCHRSCLAFAERVIQPEEIRGKRVLEVGSYNVNGSVREFVEGLAPDEYVGVDIAEGPGVDEVVRADKLVARFGERSFDAVLTTEMMEHVEDWRTIVRNLKGVLRLGGVLLMTTRSQGFPFHPYPIDTWRYSLEDMRAIFGDMTIEVLDADPEAPGVHMKAHKRITPHDRVDLEAIDLYRMVP